MVMTQNIFEKNKNWRCFWWTRGRYLKNTFEISFVYFEFLKRNLSKGCAFLLYVIQMSKKYLFNVICAFMNT